MGKGWRSLGPRLIGRVGCLLGGEEGRCLRNQALSEGEVADSMFLRGRGRGTCPRLHSQAGTWDRAWTLSQPRVRPWALLWQRIPLGSLGPVRLGSDMEAVGTQCGVYPGCRKPEESRRDTR